MAMKSSQGNQEFFLCIVCKHACGFFFFDSSRIFGPKNPKIKEKKHNKNPKANLKIMRFWNLFMGRSSYKGEWV
jgi:hypothetical protein